MNRCLTALLFVLAFADVQANAMADRSLDELYGQARAVVSGRLVELSAECAPGSRCGTYRSAFEVAEIHRGAESLGHGRKIVVCLAPSLKIGHEYTIFIGALRDDESGRRCDGFVDRDAAFEKRHETYFRVDSYESARIVENHGDVLYTGAIQVDSFQERLAELSGRDTRR